MSQVDESPPTNPLQENNSTQSESVSLYWRDYWRRIKSGDLGSWPIFFGLLVIVIIFQTQNENYLTPRNFVNLFVQMAGITVIAIGVVYVLLLGEIDLSIGYISAVAAVFMTLRLRPPNSWHWIAAIIAALAVVGLIGIVQGSIITKFRLPSFIVTLAGFLVWNGVVLIMIGSGGTVIIQDNIIIGIANYFIPTTLGWILAIALVVIYAINRILSWRGRHHLSLSSFKS